MTGPPPVRQQLDTDNEPLSQLVVMIADLEAKAPTELEPIYDRLDDALAGLFSSPPSPEANIEVQFSYEGYRITVSQDGTAEFAPTTGC